MTVFLLLKKIKLVIVNLSEIILIVSDSVKEIEIEIEIRYKY